MLDLVEVLHPERCALYWSPDSDTGWHVMNVKDLDSLPDRATPAQLRKLYGRKNVMELS